MFIYLQTIFVYLTITFVSVILSKKYIATNNYGYIVAAVLFYSIVFGLRYGVGGDYFGYLNAFNLLSEKGQIPIDREPGFMLLMRFCAFFHSSAFFFFLIAFLQLYIILLGFKNWPQLYPYLFFVFMFIGAWLQFGNGLRQILALSIWVLSLKYAAESRPLKHYLLLLLAICFHNSAIILLPFYIIFRWRIDWFRNLKLEFLILAVSLVIMNSSFVEDLFNRLDVLVGVLGYSHYANYESEGGDLLDREVSIGIGLFITLFVNIIIIANSNKLKSFYNSNFFNVLYNLFYVGIISNYIFLHSQLFGRLVVYFYSFSFIMIACVLYYFRISHQKLLYRLSMSLVLFTFIALLYRASTNWALFVFSWQNDYFYLHNGHNI